MPVSRSSVPLMHAILAAAGLALSALAFIAPSTALAQDAPLAAKAAGDANQTLPIKRIVLYRSGVGAFERRGMIDGRAEIPLRFNTDQVNDILKSMFVLDKGGTVESIRYGSKDPLSKRLASFGIDISGKPTIAQLLEQLRGADVRITTQEGVVFGTILGIESRPEAQGQAQQPIAVTYVNIAGATGLRSISLRTVTNIQLEDEKLQGELNKALAALGEHRADRTKTVDVTVNGNGGREVIVGYIHEMPVWKTSYRLILPDSPKGDAAMKAGESTMQGWAIVENTTDEDWNSVNLSLVSGRPVSFQMDLYEPLYVFRPMIPVPTVPGVMPRAYEGGLSPFQDNNTIGRAGELMEKSAMDRDDAGRHTANQALKKAEGRMRGGGAMRPSASAEVSGAVSSEDMASYSARSQAQAVETGEVFQYELQSPVTLERQKSAMLPILSTPIPSRRVSIYNRNDGAKNPMRGVEITNATQLQFIPGPISVYDGAAYAGDAQIGHVGAGEKRLLAYSVDLEIDTLTEDSGNTEIRKIRIIDGTFEQTIKNVNSTKYTFNNKDKARARTVILEHTKLSGWDLVDPKKAAETTDSIYRFEVPVPAGKPAEIKVTQEQISSQRVGINDFKLNWLIEQSKNGKVSQAVVDAIRDVGKRQSAINDINARVQRLEAERSEIDKDQSRIRENMRTVGQQAAVYAKYLQKFTEQETRIEQIDSDSKAARAEVAKLQADLNEFVRKLNVE